MSSVFIIAEIGSVHDGSFGNAGRLIDAAADCGVDAVKFQTHIPEAETLPNAPSPAYFRTESRFDYFRRTAFDEEQLGELKNRAEGHGLEFLSSPFSVEAVELLDGLGMARYKIPSGEVTNLPLIDAAAATGRPVLLSSGMSEWRELDEAVERVRRHDGELTLLQCTSQYPCKPQNVGLNVLAQFRERYGVPVGLSDHTMGYAASLAAVAFGATVLERHFTFSRLMYGSDAAHSLEPEELARLVREVRELELMLASPVDKDDVAKFEAMKEIFEKSIVVRSPIGREEEIREDHLALLKPGTGLPPRRLPDLIGRRAVRDLDTGHILTEEDIDWGGGG